MRWFQPLAPVDVLGGGGGDILQMFRNDSPGGSTGPWAESAIYS